MAFVRTRTTKNGTISTALVESYRDDQGRPRQRILANLHRMPDVLSALAKLAAQRGLLREEKKSLAEDVKDAEQFYEVITSNTLAGHRYSATQRTKIDHLMRERKRLLKRVTKIDADLAVIQKDGSVIRKHSTASEEEIQEAIQKYKKELQDSEAAILGSELGLKMMKDELRRLSI